MYLPAPPRKRGQLAIRYATYLNSESFILFGELGNLVLEQLELLLSLDAEAESTHSVLQQSTPKQG